jgi:hypothetical protein
MAAPGAQRPDPRGRGRSGERPLLPRLAPSLGSSRGQLPIKMSQVCDASNFSRSRHRRPGTGTGTCTGENERAARLVGLRRRLASHGGDARGASCSSTERSRVGRRPVGRARRGRLGAIPRGGREGTVRTAYLGTGPARPTICRCAAARSAVGTSGLFGGPMSVMDNHT